MKICSTQTHTHTAQTHTGSRTDDIINTVPGVYCIPAGRVRGESAVEKRRKKKKEKEEMEVIKGATCL